MKKYNNRIINSLWFVLFAFLSANVGAANFADISVEEGVVYWVVDPAINYSSADLRVSAPDGSVSSELSDSPDVPSFPSEGASLSDGSYNYELTLNPPLQATNRNVLNYDETDEIDENGRNAPMVQARSNVATEVPTQTGSFSIVDGALVSPDEEE